MDAAAPHPDAAALYPDGAALAARLEAIVAALCEVLAAKGLARGLTGALIVLVWTRLRRLAARFAILLLRPPAPPRCRNFAPRRPTPNAPRHRAPCRAAGSGCAAPCPNSPASRRNSPTFSPNRRWRRCSKPAPPPAARSARSATCSASARRLRCDCPARRRLCAHPARPRFGHSQTRPKPRRFRARGRHAAVPSVRPAPPRFAPERPHPGTPLSLRSQNDIIPQPGPARPLKQD
ncbi:hypothetical protein [Acidiphilium sp.]|uniref:hypothetical protein n=1 Tax=Acidiphilium sp. TaxID=527 RepID=UPI002585313C|nr:hypothetical protein [Acidiphilium sp.]